MLLHSNLCYNKLNNDVEFALCFCGGDAKVYTHLYCWFGTLNEIYHFHSCLLFTHKCVYIDQEKWGKKRKVELLFSSWTNRRKKNHIWIWMVLICYKSYGSLLLKRTNFNPHLKIATEKRTQKATIKTAIRFGSISYLNEREQIIRSEREGN